MVEKEIIERGVISNRAFPAYLSTVQKHILEKLNKRPKSYPILTKCSIFNSFGLENTVYDNGPTLIRKCVTLPLPSKILHT